MDGKLKAPWGDYWGCTIFVGDTLHHPSGETGVVVYDPVPEEEKDRWLVEYAPGDRSRLVLQIGWKGQGIVLDRKTRRELKP